MPYGIVLYERLRKLILQIISLLKFALFLTLKLWITAEIFILIKLLVGICVTSFTARDFHIRISAKKANTLRRIDNKGLNPYYVTGLIDAEGYFSILYIRNKNMKLGWVLRLNFQIKLSIKDKELLEKIKDALGASYGERYN